MFTEYSTQNNNENNSKNYVSPDESSLGNKIFSIIWKILLVIIVLVVLFLGLIKFGVISLNSSIAPDVVLLNQNEIGIKKGSGYQLIYSVLPENSTNKQVVWESSDPSVAEVNEVSGYVTGKKEGTAIITVKTLINEKISECVVNVTNKNIIPTRINVNEKSVNLAVGYTNYLSYRMTPANSTELNVKFISSDPSVATVNSKGVVKAVKEGNAVISVIANNGTLKDTSYVTILKEGSETTVEGQSVKTESYPKAVSLNEENVNLSIGTTSQLIANVSPDNTNKSISWTSSDSRVVSVDKNGLLTAKGVGTATVVAKTINNRTAVCKVTVGNYSLNLRKVMITTDYSVLPIGNVKQLIVAFTPSNATDRSIVWSSSNPAVAAVDQSGNVKAVAPGSAVITAQSATTSYKDTAQIEVVNYSSNVIEETGLAFPESNYQIGINKTVTLRPIFTPTNTNFKMLEFTSSNPSVAQVDENGVITGVATGTATITATTKRNRVQASVVVNVKIIEAKGVSLNSTNVKLNPNETFSLVANVSPNDATDQTVTFKSEDPSIASVNSSGIITGIRSGVTTITVTPNGGGSPSTCIVNVN